MTILVTGGSSGLGRAIVYKMAAIPENRIYFTYCSNQDRARQIENTFHNVKAIHCDFTCQESVDELVSMIGTLELDVLINNAYSGETMGTYFYRTSAEDFERAFNVNVIPLIKITKEVIRHFRKKKAGKIITVLTSVLFGVPPMGYSVYSATKAYIAQLVKEWSKEYIQYGITSNAISPDFMLTDLTEQVDEKTKEQILENNVLKRYLLPDEVAEIVVQMCYATAFMNGVNIPINAGTNI